MLGDGPGVDISDVFEDEVGLTARQLDRELEMEGLDLLQTTPTPALAPLIHAPSSDTLVPSSPPRDPGSDTSSRPRSAMTQSFNSGLMLDDVIAWDSLTVASWFDTVELEGMANRAFQHGINGKPEQCCLAFVAGLVSN
jgi:hypothetical protein